jgi:transcriptional regulator with XRE-family HTH domain
MTRKTPLICDLKSRRQALGWSRQDLSERCGIDEKLLSDWEHGLAVPRLDGLEQWATALGLRLSVSAAQSETSHGLRVDWPGRRVTVDGAPIRLTPMEWKALERLARKPGELVTHQDLFRHLYGDERDYRAQSTAIRVLITKLRRLLPLRIDAQWGRGYVVSGIEGPSPTDADAAATDRAVADCPAADRPADDRPGNSANDGGAAINCMAERPQRERIAFLPRSTLRNPPPMRRELIDLAEPTMRRHAVTAGRPGLGRAEELGVIERFLAERGATRCPDVATIERSPLPTLVWDKMKRKWVRPAFNAREAG